MLKLLLIIFSMNLFLSARAVVKLNLGVEEINYFPIYGTLDGFDYKSGEYVGYAAEVIRLYNKSQNEFQLIIELRPMNRLYYEFLSDKSIIDAKFPDNPLWNKELKTNKNIKYSNSVLDYTDGVFILKKHKGKLLKEIKTMGTISGFTPIPYLKEIESGKIKLEYSSGTTSLLKKLLLDKVDAIYLNKLIGICKLQKLSDGNNAMFDPSLPHSNSQYYLSSYKHPELIDSFNIFLKTHKENILKIKYEYIDKCKELK